MFFDMPKNQQAQLLKSPQHSPEQNLPRDTTFIQTRLSQTQYRVNNSSYDFGGEVPVLSTEIKSGGVYFFDF